MSRPRTHHTGLNRKEATAAMMQWQDQHGIPADLFWVQLDTLCQTSAPVDRAQRQAHLAQLWTLQISNAVPKHLHDYYNAWMHAFFLENPNNLRFLFVQLGSLIAKMEWVDPQNAQLTHTQMHALCIHQLEQIPEYLAMIPKHKDYCHADLMETLSHYTGPNGQCSQAVLRFFCDHYKSYLQAQQDLERKLHPTAATAPTECPAPTIQVPDSPSPALPLPVLDPTPSIDTENPDLYGLCSFIEKTSSSIYQKPLSHLYSLMRMQPHEISGRNTQAILQDFFAALRYLQIEPIDEARLKEEFPTEYQLEMLRRSNAPDTPYVLSSWGWSCQGHLITPPTFKQPTITTRRRSDHE